ncbi:MAG: hypothetical protein JXR61_06905 [Prolixibacteraceae bacterium]|nr:hypothetical protein [Prolixibacteraceae bacterium]
MKTNLLLIDSHENLKDLVQSAILLSNGYNRRLKITYVLDFDWMKHSAMAGSAGTASISIVNAEKEIFRDYNLAEKNVQDIVDEALKTQSANYSIDIDVTKNNRIDVINSELQTDPDLMVLISNRQRYSEITGGLVSYPKFIEHVKCPVLILPDKLNHPTFRNAVYATDYNPEDSRSLKHLSNFLNKSNNTSITVLHNEENFDFEANLKWVGFQDMIQAEIKNEKIDFLLMKEKDFIAGMKKFTAETDPDLLVILNQKKGFFEDLFTSSNTKNVLSQFDKPLLVYHEK